MWTMLIVQWLHVLLGLFWFGGILYTNVVIVPVMLKMDPVPQRNFSIWLNEQATKTLIPVAIATIIFGFLRGTVFGPIDSLQALTGSSYGHTFLLGLITTCAQLAFGVFVVGGAAKKLNQFPVEEVAKGTGAIADQHKATLQKVKGLVALELVGFLVIFTCMILMRFAM